MEANFIAFTATGQISTAPSQFAGLGFSGFTAVDVYNGTDNTGALIAHCTSTTDISSPVICPNGIYVVVTGTGKGTVWVR